MLQYWPGTVAEFFLSWQWVFAHLEFIERGFAFLSDSIFTFLLSTFLRQLPLPLTENAREASWQLCDWAGKEMMLIFYERNCTHAPILILEVPFLMTKLLLRHLNYFSCLSRIPLEGISAWNEISLYILLFDHYVSSGISILFRLDFYYIVTSYISMALNCSTSMRWHLEVVFSSMRCRQRSPLPLSLPHNT